MQFSDAYNVYLEIAHRVDSLINEVLGRNTPNWNLLNSCPCCFYKLEDEENLAFEWLLKARKFRTDYWLDRTTVDRFKNDVRGQLNTTTNNDDWQDVEPPNQSVPSFACVDWWQNAGPEQHKRMFAIFDESGIFIAACRHQFVLLACDMVKSGELTKYPLAIIDRLLTVYGQNGACAYDIGCAFAKTLANSTLGQRAGSLNLQMMVGAFHGHAHNRRCQLDWHPMYIEGTGHTEGEGCEHIFSSSNELARSTRHANRFHRHQSIEQHFGFWDDDKYAALTELSAIKDALNLTDTDFIRFHAQEREYLDGLKETPVKDYLSIRYINVLDELGECRWEWDLAQEGANRSLVEIHPGNLNEMHIALNQACVRVDSAYSKLQNTEGLAAHLEIQLEASLLKYRSALDELERLVVMHLFELSKLSLSGTGYKLRQQISKALQRRSDAIRNIINRYNTQAVASDPPRPKLAWKDIVEYSFLGKFDLLRPSRTDIRKHNWMVPAHHEATVKYFKLQRAHEEIQRLNVEVRRLHTSIQDEEVKTAATIHRLLETDHVLAVEPKNHYQARAAVNAVHLFRLDQLESQCAFSGRRGIGIWLGSSLLLLHDRSEVMSSPLHTEISAAGVDREGFETRFDLDDIISFESDGGNVIEHEDQAQITEDFASYLFATTD
ncbi:hypothetical protein F4604DRAFT_1920018 [Suillus subluteus]|nr:hypothetical protein F4604DRAFT_1920018 [Suillus subluteus]